MLDLTTVNLEDCSEHDFYSLLLAYEESIVLKRNIVYTYNILITAEPSVLEPDPLPIETPVYIVSLGKDLPISIPEMELISPSRILEDYGFTGERLELITRGKTIFSSAPIDPVSITDFTEVYSEQRYDYLRALSFEELDYLKPLYLECGKYFNWPIVTSEIKTKILDIIELNLPDYDLITGDEDSANITIDSLLSDLKLSLYRVFNPAINPEILR
jgi:hypothetical protein